MEINTTTAIIYSIPETDIPARPANSDEKISIWRLPKIAWACAILFCINLMIAACIAISPELKVDIYGAAAGDVVLANAKPSAFVEPEAKPKPVRQAMKLTPVVELLPESAAVMSVEIPATYRQPAYFAGSTAIEAAEKLMDFPRMSASLTPKSTAPATYIGTKDVTPRTATEPEARPTVIN